LAKFNTECVIFKRFIDVQEYNNDTLRYEQCVEQR